MAYFTASDLRQAAGGITASAAEGLLTKSASTSQDSFDVFLSHSIVDAQLIYGLKRWLESLGSSVYVDWINDRQLDRSHVSAATAAVVRDRMGQSKSMIYATSRAASRSRWMPWELGYFDGRKGPSLVSICPVETGATGSFVGEEFLGLYNGFEKLFVNGNATPYVTRRRSGSLEAQTIRSFVNGTGRFTTVTS